MNDFEFVGPCKDLTVPSTEANTLTVKNEWNHAFVFFDHPKEKGEMLKISPDGFWVRGVKVEQGPEEAKEVYEAFLKLLGYNNA
jgi:hypothetical protein